MKVVLLAVPYHLGHRGVAVGAAPAALLAAGAAEMLRRDGHDVEVVEVRRCDPFTDELRAIAEVDALLATRVREAAEEGLPVVLGGDCNVSLGVVAGLPAGGGCVWFDAHGDFNTPETSPKGSPDGRSLAIACGLCHQEIWQVIGGQPLAEEHVALVGSRDLDPGEQQLLADSRVQVVSAQRLGSEAPDEVLAPAFAAIAGRGPGRRNRSGGSGGVKQVFIHVDVDVLDPTVAPAVDYPSPGGLEPDELIDALRAVGDRFRVSAVTLTAFDPTRDDPDGRTLGQALELLRELVAVATGPGKRGRA